MHTEPDRELAAVQRAFVRWRGSPTRGGRIPQELWLRAVILAKRVGVSRTAIALRLDYYSLQRRLGSAPIPASGFLEVTGAQLGVAEVDDQPRGVVIALRRPDGTELTVRLGDGATSGIGTLCERLWRMGQ